MARVQRPLTFSRIFAIKIAGTGLIRTSTTRRRGKREGASESSFAEYFGQPRTAGAAGAAAPIRGIDGLLPL